jgi:hypothetical protein
MGEYAPVELGEAQRSLAERCMTEVDHLSRLRQPDGSHAQGTLEAVNINLLTAVKEAAMPYAVSTTHQEYRDGTFWWLDQSPVQVAESGYIFHKHQSAFDRVAVEIDEATDVETNLRRGLIKVFISPRMSEADAPREIAKQEHLAEDDMLRIHMLDTDEEGQVRGKFMQSLLVRHVPLRAWVTMLRDPNNIFGKTIEVKDEHSALAVMKTHRELELPEAALPEGVVTLLEAVLPYLDTEERREVESQLLLFRGDQVKLDQTAKNIADRWLAFEVALSDSLYHQRAMPEVEAFINQLQHEWGDETQHLLAMHRLDDGGLFMTRELAIKLEEARQNTLWVSAAVVTHNQRVLSQMDAHAAQHIYDNEMFVQTMMYSGYTAHQIAMVEAVTNRMVAQQNVQVGGGCPGNNRADFKSGSDDKDDPRDRRPGEVDEGENSNSKEGPSKKKWMNCPFCKAEKFGDPCAKRLHCNDCRAYVVKGEVKWEGDGGSKARAEREDALEEALVKEIEEIFANMKDSFERSEAGPPQGAAAATGQLALVGSVAE